MIEDSIDGEALCPHCGAKVVETDYACPNCGQVVRWRKKPDQERAEESAAEVCKCGHPRAAHDVMWVGADFSPCVKRGCWGCSCTTFTPQPTTPAE